MKSVKLCLGIILLVLSCTIPFLGLWVAGLSISLAIKSTIIGLLTVGAPEVLALLAVALLGKEAFELLTKRLLSAMCQLAPKGSVGRTRYKAGLALFLLTFIPGYLTVYTPHLLSDNPQIRVGINVCADLLFVASLFILGGDFWDKLRSLFIYDAKATFPNNGQS